MKSLPTFLLSLFASSAFFAGNLQAAEMFPFVLPWDDFTPSAIDVSFLNDKPAGKDGFVTVKEGHLFTGTKRFRIVGVNTCFGANFPKHEDAEKVAARMAKFGINCVRFHHMDMMKAPGGIFAADGKTLDPGQLDKLDYFIAKLKEHGIYADLNLHVSRTYPDRPREEKKANPSYDKGVDNYCAAMIALQKDYARDLLTHVNAYTGKRYAEEPSVAIVEINNENSLGFQWWASEMENLPAVYADELSTLWTAWLKTKYPADEKLGAAWSEGARDGGQELLAEAKGAWSFEGQGGAKTKGEVKDGAITYTVEQPGAEVWHAQFNRAGIKVAAGESYTVTFKARASKALTASVNLMQTHEPWKVLGSKTVNLSTEWREITATFSTNSAEESARFTVTGFGQTPGVFEFKDLALRTATIDGTAKRDEAGRIPYFTKSAFATRTSAARRDWQEFMWDTETTYWNGMRDFLKKELGVKAPIVGTQGFWSSGFVQHGMDIIDSHAYWHHPDFHGRGWNDTVWDVKNESMAGAADGGELPRLATQRVVGMPFICTEYNHPAPNTHGAECFPLVFSYASVQDWDGVFAFSYCHRTDAWAQDHFNNYFDIDRNTVKMATLPAAALSYRRGDIPLAPLPVVTSARYEGGIDEAIKSGPCFNGTFARADALTTFYQKVGYQPLLLSGPLKKGNSEADWTIDPNLVKPLKKSGGPKPNALMWDAIRKVVIGASARSAFLVGNVTVGETVKLGDFSVSVTPGETRQGWASYQFTVLEGDSFANARRILITATADTENTGMLWKTPAKTSVGRDWGKPPVLVEAPAAKILLPGTTKLRAWALDERGQRRAEIPLLQDRTLTVDSEYRTLWYEVAAE